MSDEERLINKLKKALTASSVAEKNVLNDLIRIRDIKEQRIASFNKYKSEEEKLNQQLKTLNSECKIPALLKGQVASAANSQAVSNTIMIKLDLCRKNLENSFAELQKANEREEEVENNLNQIRTEQKQIEKIIDNRSFISKIVKDASDEISIEEILYKGKSS